MIRLIEEIIGHLGAAQVQGIPSDDSIISGHINQALIAAKLLRATYHQEEAKRVAAFARRGTKL